MVLKRSSSLQLVVATTTTHPATTATSIWERLPYNVGMELHSFPNAAAAASNNCYQQQRQHSFENSPPQRDMLATTTTPLSRGSRQQERPAAATEEIDILQQQPEHNKFTVDYSTKATTATDVVTQLKVQKEAGESRSEVVDTHRRAAATERNPSTNSTTTTTAAGSAPALQPLSRCCCGENTTTASTSTNTKVITTATGDIPQGTTPVCRSSSSSNGSGNAPPGRALQQLRTSDQHKYKGQLEQGAQGQEPLRPKDAVVPAMWSPCASLGRGVWLLLLLTSVTQCWAGRQDALSNCTFPARWEGSWFLSGYQQSIHIKGSQFSYRGKCAASDGNKYLIVDEKGCHRCLVIYEKHKNVLQYKESECEGDSMYLHQTNPSAMAMRSVLKQNGDHSRGGAHPNSNGHSRLSSSDQYIMRSNDDMNDYFCKGRETLQNLCDQIPGDALLYSLFRESAEPVKCPLKGPFVFTYNRGHGECKSPVSNIDSCTEDSRLLLSFQACPDVQGTESTVEELTCLATWKDGNSRYLVGLVSHHHAISNEERYRCFVYEKISSLMGGPGITSAKDAEYKLAQSGDATCNGLDSAEVGSRIMSLRKPPPAERCDFPAWFKGPRHWHALMGNAIYNYHSNDGSMHIIKPNGYMETRALCEQINKQTATEMMAVVHYTTGCQSGFMCMMFYRRDTHVIEIQTGKQASRLEDACAPDHFDVNRMPFITLLANNPDPQICPLEGLYNLRGAIGPPYISSRHKRNHNNKAHSGHGHHHLQHDLGAGGADGGAGGNAFGHKRHNTLSFRNSDEVEHSSWHSHTRGVPNRSRRAATATAAVTATAAPVAPSTPAAASSALEVDGLEGRTSRALRLDASRPQTADARVALAAGAALPQSQSSRSRRDAPGCVVNYKAQRQLMVGCTEENIIDVRERCNDDGDEEYSCHGSWSENGTVYIIARHKGTKHGVCVSYRPTEAGAAKLVIGDACYRGPMMPPEHHLVANLTVFGKCGDTSAARPSFPAPSWGAALAAGLASATAALALALAHPPLAAR